MRHQGIESETVGPHAVSHMAPDDFRRVSVDLTAFIARYWSGLESLPVNPAAISVRPGDLLRRLPTAPPESPATPAEWDRILADLSDLILPHLTNWQSPHFYAYFPCNASFPAILAELLSAGLNQQGMLWSASPACTELEIRVLDWLAELLGLPPAMRSTGAGGGVILGTASEATLTALVAARARTKAALRAANHPAASNPHLTLYTSAQAHSSVIKAAMVAGLADGPDDRTHLRLIDVDDRQCLRPDLLREAIDADWAAGRIPFFVTATMGTTGTTAMDPLDEMVRASDVSLRARGKVGPRSQPSPIWLHCDAAHAGACLICPELRSIAAGLDRFDSFCFNPHKWLLTNFDCDCFYVRDRAALTSALSITPEYLRNPASDSGAATDYRDWQVPLGRRFRSLKLWFVLRHYGAEGVRAHVREHIRLATMFESWLGEDDRFELPVPRTCNLVCFRLRGPDALTRRLMEALNASGRVFLSHTTITTANGPRFLIRMAIGAATTQERHVRQARAWIADEATRVLADQ